MAAGKKYLAYHIGDRKVPSVTQVLGIIDKPGLLEWSCRLGIKEANRQRDDAGKFGHEVHDAIEVWATRDDRPIPQHVQKALGWFIEWSEQYVEEWVCFEQAVFHDELLYAGTSDAFAIMKGSRKLVLVDFKTSKSMRDTYDLQVAAYLNATRIEHPGIDLSKVDGAIILHMNRKSEKWEAHPVQDLPGKWEAFKAALTLYKWRNYG